MRRHLRIYLTLIILLASASASAQPVGQVKDELGLTRMKVIFPEPGARITSVRPMITADLSVLETPADITTVTVLLNGSNMTETADITSTYIFLQPQADLPAGDYEVRITAKDVNRADIEPLSWTFTVLAPEVGHEVETKAENDNTTGRLALSTDYVAASYTPKRAVDISQFFREKEGMKLNADLSFTNNSDGRTIYAAYHRETQAYTDREIDKIRLNYHDANFDAVLGNAWFMLSDLTVAGTEMEGVKLDKTDGPLTLTFFSGRTQSQKTSGALRQMTTGARTKFAWNAKNATSLTVLGARETNDISIAMTTPAAEDRIISLLHEYKCGDSIVGTAETAWNSRRISGGSATKDTASRISVVQSLKRLRTEAELYTIPENFYVVAEGSARNLLNNREGGRLKGSYVFARWIAGGGEYERYDSATGAMTFRAKHASAFVKITPADMPQLMLRTGKFTTGLDVDSESNSLFVTSVLPDALLFSETRFSGGLNKNNYSFTGTTGILTESKGFSSAVNTTISDILKLSASYSANKVNDQINLTSIGNRNFSSSLVWGAVASRLNLKLMYDQKSNSGAGSDNMEKDYGFSARVAAGKKYTIVFGVDVVDYTDPATPQYDYTERIVRTGMEQNF